MAQPMQQCINGLDAVGLGERVAVRQVSDDSGLSLLLGVVLEPTAQLDKDVEGG